ncbi:MAG: T9SS type A sorting domain-containing protein [Ignavibacteriales bacterium]|nr:T9SS type A sorting domain-containing protein [Ignavibacteriales bacterium]
MPVDITVRTATSDTTFIVNVNQQQNTFQFTVAEEPNDVLLDKDDWILSKIITSVDEDEELVLKEYSLSQNYPNPFNSNCAIKYSIPKSSQVSLKIFNVLGSEIEILVDEEKPIGTYELNWNAANLPSGVYFYRLQAESFVQTRKMILLK